MTPQPPPQIEPLRLTREMILEEAVKCDVRAALWQHDAEAAWDRNDAEVAMACERDAVQMKKAARYWRAYADSPDGYPPEEPHLGALVPTESGDD